jgi:murein DD-endopeptidase MepM/ murein hydrolase activator NlpD
MCRYGWLMIIDHPEMNFYSLYGHLSPSRWRMEPGPVTKGDLIAYLGDEWENGGSREGPLVAHLHFGLRTGQRTGYPGRGEWRWMAGWIRPCPRELGWLQPSVLMADQLVPTGGFKEPVGGFFEKWRTDLMITGAIVAGGVWWLGIGIRKNQPLIPIIAGLLLGGVTWYLRARGLSSITPVFVLAVGMLLAGVWIVVHRFTNLNS